MKVWLITNCKRFFCTITETGQTNRELSYFDVWERATKQVTGISCCMKHLGMDCTNTPAATAQT